MFLPIVVFIPNAFYYGFNEHATNSETTTINYKYQSNEVNSYDDLVEGNIYHFNYNGYGDEMALPNNYEMDLKLLKVYQYNFNNCNFDLDSTTWSSIFDNSDISVHLYYNRGLDANLNINLNSDETLFIYYGTFDTEFLLNAEVQITYLTYSLHGENLCLEMNNTDYNVIESVEINTDDTISNKMYHAWQSTWDLPLLQWTHTSFVAQPFTYITGLFGVPSDSTFNYVFAYFVSISICWLVFDVIMYLPNLAHRWLDRGALE